MLNGNRSARPGSRARRSKRGNSLIELTFLMPWILFLFVGAFDWGFYAYALIATEHAVRVGVLHTSSSATLANDTAGACTYALEELTRLPNVGSLANCTSLPVIVVATAVPSGADGAPASQVSVTYQSSVLIPIPGLLTKQLTVTRIAQMRVKG